MHKAVLTSHLTHPKYRADIDGLRAVAVLSVVGFHAFPAWIRGGFVGVDIFFVISGFLISTIIFSNLEHGSFRFAEFYGRRIRRIFPALLIVLMVCYGFGWFTLFADEYSQLGKHIAAGAGFVSNIVLWRESGYFDAAAEAKPLLHLWSLGIEEQFYIVWPLLLWVAYRFCTNILILIFVIAVASFAWNVWQVDTNAVAAFYSPQTRFWELLIGSLLAWFSLQNRHRIESPDHENRNGVAHHWHNLASILGAGVILTALLLTSSERPFPGWWALLPTVGAALLIFGGSQVWINRKVLANPVMVWFGLISFPLYLWHWPVLYFVRITSVGPVPWAARIVAIAVSVVLAWLTYKLIETPLRHGGYAKAKTLSLASLMTLVGAVGYFCYYQDGLGFRYTASQNDYLARAWHLRGDGITDCGQMLQPTPDSFCATATDPVIAIIGDSHAGALFHGIINNDVDMISRRAIVLGAGSCQPTLGAEARKGCDQQLRKALDIIEDSPTIQTVILAGYFAFVDAADSPAADRYFIGYRKTIAELEKSKKKIVFLIDNPSWVESPERCQPRTLPLRSLSSKEPDFCRNPKMSNLRNQNEYLKFVERLKVSNPEIRFFDAKSSLCGQENCPLFKSLQLLYGDFNHLSIYGSQLLANDLLRSLSRTGPE